MFFWIDIYLILVGERLNLCDFVENFFQRDLKLLFCIELFLENIGSMRKNYIFIECFCNVNKGMFCDE